MRPSTRRLVASLALLIYVPAYVVLAATIGDRLATAPQWLGLLYFAVAGVLWVIPLRPLFKWMNQQAPRQNRT
jgi:hypothetical protein